MIRYKVQEALSCKCPRGEGPETVQKCRWGTRDNHQLKRIRTRMWKWRLGHWTGGVKNRLMTAISDFDDMEFEVEYSDDEMDDLDWQSAKRNWTRTQFTWGVELDSIRKNRSIRKPHLEGMEKKRGFGRNGACRENTARTSPACPRESGKGCSNKEKARSMRNEKCHDDVGILRLFGSGDIKCISGWMHIEVDYQLVMLNSRSNNSAQGNTLHTDEYLTRCLQDW